MDGIEIVARSLGINIYSNENSDVYNQWLERVNMVIMYIDRGDADDIVEKWINEINRYFPNEEGRGKHVRNQK